MIYLVRTAGHREQIRGQTRGAGANHKIILFDRLPLIVCKNKKKKKEFI